MDAGVVLGIGSIIFSAIVSGVSFWFAYKTSTAAAARATEIAQDMKKLELRKAADTQIAAYRMQWIGDLRANVARFYGIQKELNRADFAGDKEKVGAMIESLYPIKQHILMLLKQDSESPAEMAIEELLKSRKLNHEQLIQLVESTRVVLKEEWRRTCQQIVQ